MRKGFLVVVACASLGGCLEDPVQMDAGRTGVIATAGSEVDPEPVDPSSPAPAVSAAALAANASPVIQGSPAPSVVVGTSYLFQPSAQDPDGSPLAFGITGQPGWARFDARTGELSGSPSDADAGETADIVISASDGFVTVALPPFRIAIQPRPAPPPVAAAPRNVAPALFGTAPPTARTGTPYAFTPQAVDPDGPALTFTIVNRPAWAAFSTATGTLSGTPAAGQAGTYRDIVISVSDGALSASLAPFSIEVSPPPNRPPSISGLPPTSARVGADYYFRPAVSDPDGDTVRLSIRNAPAWMSFVPSTGEVQARPGAGDVGTFAGITISATDGQSSADLPPFTVTVAAAPDAAPTLGGTPSTAVTAGSPYAFQPNGYDAEGQTLTYAISNRPAWAAFSTTTGALTGTPTAADIGSHSGIVISVSDGRQATSLPAFAIAVTAVPNAAPRIGGAPATTVVAGSPFAFTPIASDPDGQPLTFSIQNRPAWASFSPSSGALTGTPTRAQVGAYRNIVIGVSDGSASVSLPAFSITVDEPPNQAPQINGSPAATVVAGTSYSFVPAASDPDGQTLSFSIQNRPTWAGFNAASGALTGTPTRAQVGVYPGIAITVSDGLVTTTLPPFTVSVTAPPNQAPQITGTPSTSIATGQPYSFVPSASDADGQSLTFSILNRPSWAQFNAATGALTGTPASTDAGSYAGIAIRVSDGTATTSLPAFTLVVTAPPPVASAPEATTGSATVVWAAPTQNEDGSTVRDLAGYRIYSGASASSLTLLTQVGAAATSATFTSLARGTYCYAVTAVTSAGQESDRSGALCKSVP
jgi:large repetitive protein